LRGSREATGNGGADWSLMEIVLYALGLFGCAFVVHLVIWRVAMPRQHTRALLVIFFVVLAVGCLAPLTSFLGRYGPGNVWDYMAVVFFFGSGSLAYIAFYSAIEEDSPSLALVKAVAETGDEGMGREKCHEVIGDDFLVNRRLEVMVRDGMLRREGDRYYLGRKGEQMFCIFEASARFFGLPRGG
jgi:hypothetical protein